ALYRVCRKDGGLGKTQLQVMDHGRRIPHELARWRLHDRHAARKARRHDFGRMEAPSGDRACRRHGAGAGMRPRMLLAFLLERPSEWCAAKSPRSAAARCPSGVAKYWLRAVSSI